MAFKAPASYFNRPQFQHHGEPTGPDSKSADSVYLHVHIRAKKQQPSVCVQQMTFLYLVFKRF